MVVDVTVVRVVGVRVVGVRVVGVMVVVVMVVGDRVVKKNKQKFCNFYTSKAFTVIYTYPSLATL